MKHVSRMLAVLAVVSAVFFSGCAKDAATPLDAPGLSYQTGATWYEVNWDEVSDAVGYSVSTDEGKTWSLAQTTPKFRKIGLKPETTYDVWVKSVGDGEKHTDSKAAKLEITTDKEDPAGLTKLAKPELSHEAGVRDCRVEWDHVGNASGYCVSVDGCDTWGEVQDKNHFIHGGLDPATKYTVHVKAVGDGITYSDSDTAEIEFTTLAEEPQDLDPLDAPVLDYQANARAVRITWTAVEDATGYRISTDGCTTWSNKQSGTYFDYSGLTPETTYTVHVKAIGDGVTCCDSEPAEITVTTAVDTYVPGEYSYIHIWEAKEIVPGAKYLIVYLGSEAKVPDNTSEGKLAAIDITDHFSVQEDLFASNETTDSYAFTIKDAGGGYYYLENPQGKNIGLSSAKSSDLSVTQTGDNAKWEIVGGSDLGNGSFHINNVLSMTGTVARRITYRGYSDQDERDYNWFGAYNQTDHVEYCEPSLYMLNKKPETIDPTPDPTPVPGDVLKYIPLTDPENLFSGEKCLVAFADALPVRVMNHELGIYHVWNPDDDPYEQPEVRPAAVDMSAHFSSAKNMFAHNATTQQYAFTFTKGTGGYYLTNPDGECLTAGFGTEMSFQPTVSDDALWTLTKGDGAGTIRIGTGSRAIAYYSYEEYDKDRFVFGNYATSNIGGTKNYKETKLYVLRGIKDDGGEDPGPAVETGFPASWNMASASASGRNCYATSGNTGAYITATDATEFSMKTGPATFFAANKWDETGASWLICAPVTNVTAGNVTLNFKMYSSSTGPKKFVMKYSTDGGKTYKSAGNNNFSVGTSAPDTAFDKTFTPDLTGFPKMLYIKLEVNSSDAAGGGSIGAGGTSRIYDVTLTKWNQ